MKKRIVVLALLGALLVTGVFACGKEEKKVTKKAPEPETETQEVVYVDPHEGLSQCDLCGEWISPEENALRPVACMIENSKACQPQYGTSNADIYYECPVEGGMTRMMVVFKNYNNMEKFGNIRSCRHYFAYFAHEYDAIYIHAGASDYANNGVLSAKYIDDFDAISGRDEPYFHRDSSEHKAPHNLYTSSQEITEGIAARGFRTTLNEDYQKHFSFSEEDAPVMLENGGSAAKVSMYYPDSKPWFEFNSSDGLYYRYEFNQAQTDGLTGQQLAVKNIIIQNMDVYELTRGSELLDMTFVGSGNGYYITNGKYVEINWRRDSEYDITHYYDLNGNELVINPGKTWIEISANNKADKNVFE